MPLCACDRRRDRHSHAMDKTFVARPRPSSSPLHGVGTDSSSAVLIAAGDNPRRQRSEATFAHLCDIAPIDASSGRRGRHRLNRGGDRQTSSALWHITLTGMVRDGRTKPYIARQIEGGRTRQEAMRCAQSPARARDAPLDGGRAQYALVPLQDRTGQGSSGERRRCCARWVGRSVDERQALRREHTRGEVDRAVCEVPALILMSPHVVAVSGEHFDLTLTTMTMEHERAANGMLARC